jgi:hypothetical protein
MRVKLSYSVKSEDVLKEAAKILSLSGDDMSRAIALFNSVQEELRADNSDDGVVNIKRAKEMMEEFRTALLSIDTRLMEVSEIVVGYDDYQHALDSAAPPMASPPPVAADSEDE